MAIIVVVVIAMMMAKCDGEMAMILLILMAMLVGLRWYCNNNVCNGVNILA